MFCGWNSSCFYCSWFRWYYLGVFFKILCNFQQISADDFKFIYSQTIFVVIILVMLSFLCHFSLYRFFFWPIWLLVLKNGIEACARSGRAAVFEPYALLFSKYPIHLNCSEGCDWAVLGPKRLTSSVTPPPPPPRQLSRTSSKLAIWKPGRHSLAEQLFQSLKPY